MPAPRHPPGFWNRAGTLEREGRGARATRASLAALGRQEAPAWSWRTRSRSPPECHWRRCLRIPSPRAWASRQWVLGAGFHPPPPPVASLPPPNGSVECARAEPAASCSLPGQILLWRAAPSRAGGRRQPRLGSCPELPAPPRPELPGLGAAAQPSANKGGREAPRSAAKYLPRPVGSARLRPEAACRKPLGKLAIRLILIRD